MRKIRLSICIPTYNFGSFIGETLNSILPQMTDHVEIVIVDGASTDNTEKVVQSFQAIQPNINYIRLQKRGGIDYDMALAVDYATGEYCWLFGADDIMKKEAIPFILHEINAGHDLYLCETTICNFNLEPIRRYRNLNFDYEKTFNLSNAQERHEYFRLALNTQPFFSFCGALIFKKTKWTQSQSDDLFMGSCWAHAARIFSMLSDGLIVKHLPQSLSLKRSDNDSFLEKGLVNRIRIGIEGYARIGEYFFGRESMEYFHIKRCLRREYTLGLMWRAKNKCLSEEGESKQNVVLLNELFNTLYTRLSLPFLLFHYTPNGIIQPLLKLWRAAKRQLDNTGVWKNGTGV